MSDIHWFDKAETGRLIAYVERQYQKQRPGSKIGKIILPNDCYLTQWNEYKKVWRRISPMNPNDVIHVVPVMGKVVSIPMPHDFVWQEIYDAVQS